MRFYGSIDAERGKQTTRGGHRWLRSHTRGWSVGIEAELSPAAGAGDSDWAHAAITGGSGSGWSRQIARARSLPGGIVEVEVYGPEGQAGDPLTVFRIVDGSVDYDWDGDRGGVIGA